MAPELETGTKDLSKAQLSELINGTTSRLLTDLLLTPNALGYNLQLSWLRHRFVLEILAGLSIEM